MQGSSEEKKLLIESMKKLVTHVSNNPQRQREIFDALSLQDLNKIILNLRDDNEYLRRISALLLCELFYQNAQTKAGAVRLLGIQPPFGRICLSGIPESIHKYPSTLKKCIELMQTAVAEDEQERICWIINLERKTLKLEALEYKKYSSFTFIDPLKNIFGFASFDPAKKDQKDFQASVERARDVDGRASTQLNSEFYKNYLESRNRSKDSKRGSFSTNYANLSVDLGDAPRPGFTRPITTRQNANYTTRQEPNNAPLDSRPSDIRPHNEMKSSMEMRPSTHSDIRPNTIHNISQYARNSYNPKLNRSTYEPQRVEEKEAQTDRRAEGERRSGNTSPVVTNHQKFYKRVKDILKK